jgi:cation transport regulator ChaB
MTDKIRDSLQNMYDRGIISKRTYAEVVGEVDFDIEVQRREVEKDEGLEDVMFPPVINNIDEQMGKISNEPPKESENKTPTKEKAEVLEVAMYKTVDDLPSNVKDVLPKSAQAIWMKVFNDSFPKGEDYARKVAWTVIKKLYKKVEDKWELKKKVKGMAFSSATAEGVLTDVMKLQDLQLKEAQLKLITRFLKEEEA